MTQYVTLRIFLSIFSCLNTAASSSKIHLTTCVLSWSPLTKASNLCDKRGRVITIIYNLVVSFVWRIINFSSHFSVWTMFPCSPPIFHSLSSRAYSMVDRFCYLHTHRNTGSIPVLCYRAISSSRARYSFSRGITIRLIMWCG